MPNKWWRCSITFMGAGESREEVVNKIRMLMDGIPLPDMRLAADPMSEGEVLRGLDREDAKRAIEDDSDEGSGTLNQLLDQVPLIDIPEGAEMMLGGMVPAPKAVHPWEQGVNIFPADHPLAPYEALARTQNDTAAMEKLKMLAPTTPDQQALGWNDE